MHATVGGESHHSAVLVVAVLRVVSSGSVDDDGEGDAGGDDGDDDGDDDPNWGSLRLGMWMD